MYFVTTEASSRSLKDGRETHYYGKLFETLDEAKDFAIRKAARSFGTEECAIFTETNKTKTSAPSGVTVEVV